MAFANKQLSQINRGCSNIEEDFSNGVNLVVMMSLAEGYYVPMYSFSMEPTAYDHKVRVLIRSFFFKTLSNSNSMTIFDPSV